MSAGTIISLVVVVFQSALIGLLVWNTRRVVKLANRYIEERNEARDAHERIRLTCPTLPERDQRDQENYKEIDRLKNLLRAMRQSYRKRLGRGMATVQLERYWNP